MKKLPAPDYLAAPGRPFPWAAVVIIGGLIAFALLHRNKPENDQNEA